MPISSNMIALLAHAESLRPSWSLAKYTYLDKGAQ